MSPFTKICPFCAEEIAEEAIKCKHCGSMLVGGPADGQAVFDYPPKEVTVPMLVSAAWNIGTAFLWAVVVPCFGLLIAVPYGLLALFEFITFQDARTMNPQRLYNRCGTLAVLQILLGLTNIVPVACGIILLVYRDRVLQYHSPVE